MPSAASFSLRPESSTETRGDRQVAEPVQVEVSVVMPCLNEAETLERCITKAQQVFRDHQVTGEVIVADNGSTDGSQEIATRLGARVVKVESRGYGNALMGGILAARGKYVIMGDADDSYDFRDIPVFLEELRAGYGLVLGNRFKGGIAPDAMPPLHKHFGNPLLTALGRLFFHCPSGDVYCGLRGFARSSILDLNLRTTGMEFAIEMIVKGTLSGLPVTEVPTTLSPDGRSRPPHLRTWVDGWRTLRFMLLYSPRWLFLYPGALLVIVGLAVGIWLLPGPRTVGTVTFDAHTLLYAAMAVLIGVQAISFAVFAKMFAIGEGLLPEDPRLSKLFRVVTLEVGLVIGGILIVGGLAGSVYAVNLWRMRGFGHLDYSATLRMVIPATVAVTLGFQTILSSFLASLLRLARR